MNLLRSGIRMLAGGARRGSPFLAALGTAGAVVGVLRRVAQPRRRLLYAWTLRDGQSVTVRLMGKDEIAQTGSRRSRRAR